MAETPVEILSEKPKHKYTIVEKLKILKETDSASDYLSNLKHISKLL